MAFLQITSADGNPQRFSIEKDRLTIGRASDNDLVLEDDIISSHHCQLTRDGEGYTLTDLDSTNGTFLNGQPVKEARLEPGDVVVAGKTAMEFNDDAPAAGPSAPAAIEAAAAPASLPTAAGELVPGFEPRHDTRGMGISLLIAGAAVVTGAAVWFLFVLLKS